MRATAGALIVFLCLGCATTQVVVKKVTGQNPPDGIRYSLPRPFLLVTPNSNGDGGFKAEVIYLPDDNQTYAIDASTKRGKYKLNVAVKDGLLSKVAWAQTDSSIAAEGIRASGEILKSELGRVKAEEDERRKESKAAQEEAAKARQALEQDLAAKELDVKLAEAEVVSADAANDHDKTTNSLAALRTAQLKLDQAVLRRDAAKTSLDEYDKKAGVAEGTFNEPTTPGSPSPGRAQFWGPVLYAIVDDGTTVSLKAMKWNPSATQISFDTAATPKPVPPKMEAPKLKDTNPRSFSWPKGDDAYKMTVELTGPITSVRTAQRQMYRKQGDGSLSLIPDNLFNPTVGQDKTILKITLPKPLDPGSYQLVVPFIWGDNQDGSVTFEIDVSR